MLGVILAAAVAAAAPPPTSSEAPASADPTVCRVEPIPGSRITQRICLRASELARRKADARWLLDRAQSASEAPRMATIVPMGPMHAASPA
jgi:hypothetical protein